eukprot:gene22357-29454_t
MRALIALLALVTLANYVSADVTFLDMKVSNPKGGLDAAKIFKATGSLLTSFPKPWPILSPANGDGTQVSFMAFFTTTNPSEGVKNAYYQMRANILSGTTGTVGQNLLFADAAALPCGSTVSFFMGTSPISAFSCEGGAVGGVAAESVPAWCCPVVTVDQVPSFPTSFSFEVTNPQGGLGSVTQGLQALLTSYPLPSPNSYTIVPTPGYAVSPTAMSATVKYSTGSFMDVNDGADRAVDGVVFGTGGAAHSNIGFFSTSAKLPCESMTEPTVLSTVLSSAPVFNDGADRAVDGVVFGTGDAAHSDIGFFSTSAKLPCESMTEPTALSTVLSSAPEVNDGADRAVDGVVFGTGGAAHSDIGFFSTSAKLPCESTITIAVGTEPKGVFKCTPDPNNSTEISVPELCCPLEVMYVNIASVNGGLDPTRIGGASIKLLDTFPDKNPQVEVEGGGSEKSASVKAKYYNSNSYENPQVEVEGGGSEKSASVKAKYFNSNSYEVFNGAFRFDDNLQFGTAGPLAHSPLGKFVNSAAIPCGSTITITVNLETAYFYSCNGDVVSSGMTRGLLASTTPVVLDDLCCPPEAILPPASVVLMLDVESAVTPVNGDNVMKHLKNLLDGTSVAPIEEGLMSSSPALEVNIEAAYLSGNLDEAKDGVNAVHAQISTLIADGAIPCDSSITILVDYEVQYVYACPPAFTPLAVGTYVQLDPLCCSAVVVMTVEVNSPSAMNQDTVKALIKGVLGGSGSVSQSVRLASDSTAVDVKVEALYGAGADFVAKSGARFLASQISVFIGGAHIPYATPFVSQPKLCCSVELNVAFSTSTPMEFSAVDAVVGKVMAVVAAGTLFTPVVSFHAPLVQSFTSAYDFQSQSESFTSAYDFQSQSEVSPAPILLLSESDIECGSVITVGVGAAMKYQYQCEPALMPPLINSTPRLSWGAKIDAAALVAPLRQLLFGIAGGPPAITVNAGQSSPYMASIDMAISALLRGQAHIIIELLDRAVRTSSLAPCGSTVTTSLVGISQTTYGCAPADPALTTGTYVQDPSLCCVITANSAVVKLRVQSPLTPWATPLSSTINFTKSQLRIPGLDAEIFAPGVTIPSNDVTLQALFYSGSLTEAQQGGAVLSNSIRQKTGGMIDALQIPCGSTISLVAGTAFAQEYACVGTGIIQAMSTLCCPLISVFLKVSNPGGGLEGSQILGAESALAKTLKLQMLPVLGLGALSSTTTVSVEAKFTSGVMADALAGVALLDKNIQLGQDDSNNDLGFFTFTALIPCASTLAVAIGSEQKHVYSCDGAGALGVVVPSLCCQALPDFAAPLPVCDGFFTEDKNRIDFLSWREVFDGQDLYTARGKDEVKYDKFGNVEVKEEKQIEIDPKLDMTKLSCCQQCGKMKSCSTRTHPDGFCGFGTFDALINSCIARFCYPGTPRSAVLPEQPKATQAPTTHRGCGAWKLPSLYDLNTYVGQCDMKNSGCSEADCGLGVCHGGCSTRTGVCAKSGCSGNALGMDNKDCINKHWYMIGGSVKGRRSLLDSGRQGAERKLQGDCAFDVDASLAFCDFMAFGTWAGAFPITCNPDDKKMTCLGRIKCRASYGSGSRAPCPSWFQYENVDCVSKGSSGEFSFCTGFDKC